MPNQVNAWSLLVQGDVPAALAIVDSMPTCVHVSGWAYVGSKRRGVVAHTTQDTAASSSSLQFSHFTIGAHNAFAAPLLFYAIILKQAVAVRHLLRLGASATVSVKGGVTPLVIARHFAANEERRSGGKVSNIKGGTTTSITSGVGSSDSLDATTFVLPTATTASSSHTAAADILLLVERYVTREQNPIETIGEDESEARHYAVEEVERSARQLIETKFNGGLVKMVCEIRDDVGGYAAPLKPPAATSSSTTPVSPALDGGASFGGVRPTSASSHTSRQLIDVAMFPSTSSFGAGGGAADSHDGVRTHVTALGREVVTFLFPRFGSYASLRARLEGICGCRVGITFDKVALERLNTTHQQEVLGGGGVEGGVRSASRTSHHGSSRTTRNANANNTTTGTANTSSRSLRSTAAGGRSHSSMSMTSTQNNSRKKPQTTANKQNTSASAAVIAGGITQMNQWRSLSTELGPHNFNAFIRQADLLTALHETLLAEKASRQKSRSVSREGDEDEDEEEDEDEYFIPTIQCIVRPVPYAAPGDDACAENYALTRNKTRISKELHAYEQLPAAEKSLVRVQNLKRQVDDEEREFHTKQNYFQFQAKKISPEALEAAMKRLYEYPVQRRREQYEEFDGDVDEQMEQLIRSRPPGDISAEQQESVDRLHFGAQEREERLAAKDEEHWAELPHPPESTLDEEEVAAIRERLTTDTRAATRAQLEAKYYGEMDARWGKKISKEEVSKLVDSCYNKPRENKEKEMVKLEAKYGDWMLRKKQFKAQPVKKYGK